MKELNERPPSLKHVMMFKGGKVDELHGQIQPKHNLFETPTFNQTSIYLKTKLPTTPQIFGNPNSTKRQSF